MKFQFSEKKVRLPENVHAYAEKKVMPSPSETSGPQAEGNWRLSRIQRIRETAHTATTKKIILVPPSRNEGEKPLREKCSC